MSDNSESKICQNCHQSFLIESDDFSFYEKIKVPPPTFCPECRLKRRLIWRNERSFYHRVCNLCGDKIISVFECQDINVYCQNCWLGDKWDSLEYGINYDFSKTFFIQYLDLYKKVPEMNLNGHISNKNSPYVNFIVEANNCHYCFGGGYIENVMFSNVGLRMKDSMEIYFSMDNEFCYEISNCQRCFKVFWSNNVKDCMNSYFLKNSINCNECIMCCNLRNKSYYYKNKQYTKEEYEKIKIRFFDGLKSDLDSLKKEFEEFILLYPIKYANILKSRNTTGDNISESSDIINGFNISKVENGKNSQDIIGTAKDIYDTTSAGINLERIYESMSVSMNITNSLFSLVIRNNSFNLNYCFALTNCSNCFGCIGLKNKQYCILNKQYTKEEYEELVPKIIKHMTEMPYLDYIGRSYAYGEFFPPELSPFAYNETIAQEYYPLTKEQALSQGYRWKDKEERNYNIDIKNEDIPDNIDDTDESIINKVIECQNKGNESTQCTEAFKIIEPEYQFYRRMKLPLPHLCPNCRHYQRLKQRNPLKLWHRKCMKEGCYNKFETSYAPDRPEIIYCEQCYQQEIY
jgi:hypothetical protein